ncbi:MAG: phosphodiester glycosidase family protein [Clostridia bacterium]|nr:phosphodiester glycosidase family protein [Clostridia bacterium]
MGRAWLTALLILCLPLAALAQPLVFSDPEAGVWRYQSEAMRVEITRRTDSSVPLVWYEADLRLSRKAELCCYLSREERPEKSLKRPDVIAQRENLIYAQSDDFFAARVGSKTLRTGLIIRGQKIYHTGLYRTYGHSFPPLDTLALFPGGEARVLKMGELTAEQYLLLGATDVLSFGPILIRGGKMDPRLETGYRDLEPRSAFGYVEPYHYIGIVVEGRHDASRGCGLSFIARRMLELGVQEALNLDGGQTAAMVFMGEQLNTTGKFRKSVVRSLSGVLGVRDASPSEQ